MSGPCRPTKPGCSAVANGNSIGSMLATSLITVVNQGFYGGVGDPDMEISGYVGTPFPGKNPGEPSETTEIQPTRCPLMWASVAVTIFCAGGSPSGSAAPKTAEYMAE